MASARRNAATARSGWMRSERRRRDRGRRDRPRGAGREHRRFEAPARASFRPIARAGPPRSRSPRRARSGRRSGVSRTSVPRIRSRSSTTTRRVSRPRAAVSRSPSSSSVKCQSTSSDPHAANARTSATTTPAATTVPSDAWAARSSSRSSGALDELAGEVVGEVERDADHGGRRQQVAQARDPAEGEQGRPRAVERPRGALLRVGRGSRAEQHGSKRLGLRRRHRRQGQLCVAASGGRLDLDADEPEQPVQERRGHDDAPHALERDRAHGAPHHARVQLQPAGGDAIAEARPGEHAEADREQEAEREERDHPRSRRDRDHQHRGRPAPTEAARQERGSSGWSRPRACSRSFLDPCVAGELGRRARRRPAGAGPGSTCRRRPRQSPPRPTRARTRAAAALRSCPPSARARAGSPASGARASRCAT